MLKVKRIKVTGTTDMKQASLGGLMPKLRVLYSGAPATTDIVIKADGDTIMTLTDTNTKQSPLYPVATQTDDDGTALTSTTPHVVNELSVTLAGGDADTVVTVEAFYFE